MSVEEASGHLEVDVWPDNQGAVDVFIAMGTQWRHGGMGGLTGMDYSAVEPVLRLMRFARKQWSDIFTGLQIMERAALAEFAQQAKQAEAERARHG